MSKLDELLDWIEGDNYGTPIALGQAARTELAALRRRAEDAEAMLRAALTDVIDYGRASMAKHKAQVIVHLPDDAKGYPRHPIFLDIDLFTGLPILTDEAREALK